MQIVIGGIVMTAYGSTVESWSEVRWTAAFLYDTLFISVFVIALGWLVYFKLIGSGEASKSARTRSSSRSAQSSAAFCS
ncbi:hypothetical protein ABER23_33795 [Paenibacillus lautus]